MKILIVVDDPPYGRERSYNGLRLAHALAQATLAADRAMVL